MDKEILEITKKFHDTYEKLASEYTYETREDTKVFDINSNNGKLMYATVNEIVSPILKASKKQKEVIDKAVKYIDNLRDESAERQGFYNCFPDDLYISDINELLDILKEVSE